MTRRRNSASGTWHGVGVLAARQHGVVGRRQLREMGLTDRMIDQALATARLFSVFPGAFALGHPQVGDGGRMIAAVLACGRGSVVSHGTAAALWGLWDRPPAAVDVIAPVESGRKIDGIRRRHVPPPTPEHRSVRETIPCTSASRTIVDLAGAVGEHSLRGTVEQAAVLGLLDIAAIDSILETGPRRRGSPRLRAILSIWRVHRDLPRFRSRLEAKVVSKLAALGGPLPLVNYKMSVGGRTIEVDLIWPQQLLVVEADGRETHDTVAAFERDRRRDRDLLAAGYRVLRVTWTQLEDEPERTLNTIARLVRGHPVRQPEEQ